MLALIDRYVRDPSVDVEKFERLLAMKRQMEADGAREDYYTAMNLAQAEIQPVARTTENTAIAGDKKHFYAKLEEIDAAIRPIYLRHGFTLSTNTVAPLVAGNIRLEVICSRGRHSERFYREAPPDTLGPKGLPNKTVLHGGASSETFLARYIRCGIFNVVFKDLDDDGTGGTIDEAQAKAIRDLLRQSGSNEAAFLKYLKAPSIEEIPYRAYPKAMSALEEKLSKSNANPS
jgi:hypothetical protein